MIYRDDDEQRNDEQAEYVDEEKPSVLDSSDVDVTNSGGIDDGRRLYPDPPTDRCDDSHLQPIAEPIG